MKKVLLATLCCWLGLAACGEDSFNETTLEMDGAKASVGFDVARPDWLPDWFVLPDDLTIQTASSDPKFGKSLIYAVVAGVTPEQVAAQQISMLQAQGYALTERSQDRRIKATHEDGTLVELVLEPYGQNDSFYRLQFHAASNADAQRARVRATAFDGTGKLSVAIDDQTLVLDGTCRVEGRLLKFSSDTRQTELYADGANEPHSLRGTVAFVRGEEIVGWSPARATPEGVASVVTISEQGFSYQGGWFDVIKTKLVTGQIDMDCIR